MSSESPMLDGGGSVANAGTSEEVTGNVDGSEVDVSRALSPEDSTTTPSSRSAARGNLLSPFGPQVVWGYRSRSALSSSEGTLRYSAKKVLVRDPVPVSSFRQPSPSYYPIVGSGGRRGRLLVSPPKPLLEPTPAALSEDLGQEGSLGTPLRPSPQLEQLMRENNLEHCVEALTLNSVYSLEIFFQIPLSSLTGPVWPYDGCCGTPESTATGPSNGTPGSSSNSSPYDDDDDDDRNPSNGIATGELGGRTDEHTRSVSTCRRQQYDSAVVYFGPFRGRALDWSGLGEEDKHALGGIIRRRWLCL